MTDNRETKLNRRKKTALTKSVESNVIKRIDELLANPEVNAEAQNELSGLWSTLSESTVEMQGYVDAILDSLAEEDEQFEVEMEENTKFKIKINRYKDKISRTRKTDTPSKVIKDTSDATATAATSKNNVKVKLPTLNIEKFDGCYLGFQTFKDTFEAAIDSRTDITDVQKFQYLVGYLEGSARKCIEGFPLTAENYTKAFDLLKDRYGNPHLVIQAHMKKITKLKPVTRNNVTELRSLLDTVESHVRSLETQGVNKEHFGALLVPLIQEKIPDDIQLEISRKLGKESWKIDHFLAYMKDEIEARDNCRAAIKSDRKQAEIKPLENAQGFTVQALISALNQHGAKRQHGRHRDDTRKRPKSCVFCRKDHYSDRCDIVTDPEKRVAMLMQNKLCFKCLKSGHLSTECEAKSKCYRCKAPNHHTAICQHADNNTTDTTRMLTPLKKSTVMLMTANVVIADTYITRRITDALGLTRIAREKFNVNTFGRVEQDLDLPAYEFVIKTNDSMNVYLQGWAVPEICDRISNQRFDIAIEKHPFVQELKLANNCTTTSEEIDILVGADFYWEIVLREAPRDDGSGLVAVPSKVGFLLSGPIGRERIEVSDSNEYSSNEHSLAQNSVSNLLINNASDERSEQNNCTPEEITEESTLLINNASDKSKSYEYTVRTPEDFTEEINVANNTINPLVENHSIIYSNEEERNDCSRCTNNEALQKGIEGFHAIEVVGINENEASIDEQILADIEFTGERYEAGLPLKETAPPLEDNFDKAAAQLRSNLARLARNKNDLQSYDSVFKDWIQSGVLEMVDENAPYEHGKITYLTHHGVKRENKETTKLRVVCNASLKGRNGVSLNDCMYTGPNRNPLLFDSLTKFRTFHIAITGDIEKAYLQIGIKPRDRDLTRVLWYDDVFVDNPKMIKLRFARVFFGATCSQALLNGARHKIAEKYERVDPEFARKVREHFYVDDLNTGVKSSNQGIELYTKMKERFQNAKFNIRKWRSNDPNLQKAIEKSENITSKDSIKRDEKVLGLRWDEARDMLKINVKEMFPPNVKDMKPTKRNILRVIAGLWDIIGFIQPVIVCFKIIFQLVCATKIGWDDVIEGELLRDWNEILDSIKVITEMQVPRCYFTIKVDDPVVKTELHGFSDSSSMIYAACVYIKSVRRSGEVDVRLVAAKSRVVPLNKVYTIPRSELLGNLVLCRLMQAVQNALTNECKLDETYYWTDSMVSLGWIKAWRKELKTFCQKRVEEIRKKSDMKRWFYINTKENPADIITRSNRNFSVLESDMWLHGPPRLRQPLKQQELTIDIDENNVKLLAPNNGISLTMNGSEFHEEVKETIHVHLASKGTVHNKISNIMNIQDVSNINKLLRITSFVLRFVDNLKRKVNREPLILKKFETLAERRKAMSLWVKDNQLSLMNESTYDQTKNSLRIDQDDDGILRSTARLWNANLSYDMRAPIVLNRHHKLAELIVLNAHVLIKHLGVKSTLVETRLKYWIPRGRAFVKHLLSKCTRCKWFNGRPYPYPETPNLPAYRLRDDTAFSAIGTDYLGPLQCKNIFGGKDTMYKCWVALYTCASTRAVILDIVPNLEAGSFISSFRKFIARRGCPKIVISDNGKYFRAERTQNFVTSKNIEWEFIPEKGAWFGGFYERLVAPVKACMKKTLGRARLSFDELLTVLHEIERILNTRPLCYVSDDITDDILTPNHMLFGRSLHSENPHEPGTTPVAVATFNEMSRRAKYLQRLIDQFWDQWRKDYVLSLREQQRQHKKINASLSPAINDVVIIHDDKIPRQQWNIGRITEIQTGADGNVRSALVKTGKTGNIFRRPINKLYPIVKSD